MYSEKRLKELSAGFNIDGGGYEFEADEMITNGTKHDVVVWDDPDWDYLTGTDPTDHKHMTVFVYSPYRFNPLPAVWDRDESCLVCVARGQFNEAERDCWCRDADKHGVAEIECSRCEGHGVVVQEPGVWAAYVDLDDYGEDEIACDLARFDAAFKAFAELYPPTAPPGLCVPTVLNQMMDEPGISLKLYEHAQHMAAFLFAVQRARNDKAAAYCFESQWQRRNGSFYTPGGNRVCPDVREPHKRWSMPWIGANGGG